MREFLVFSSIIYGFLLLGWGLRKLRPAWKSHSKNLSRLTVMSIEAPATALIFWGIARDRYLSNMQLPVIGIVVLSLSGLVGYLIARRYRGERAFTGAFTVTSMFSNNGLTMGGFLCLLYLGMEGLELAQIYILFNVPYYFIVVFMTARLFSTGRKLGLWAAIKANYRDPVSILPTAAMLIGLALALANVHFPAALLGPRRAFIFASVAMYSLSFGLGMVMRRLFRKLKYYLGMLPVKFLVAPAVGVCCALLGGYSLQSNPLAFKVILIQASMPVAIWAVVACKIFNLDGDFALGVWVFTTLCVALLLPFFAWVAGL